ncbi:hypothetical protein ACROYT_G028120 [Oculina patagonica]
MGIHIAIAAVAITATAASTILFSVEKDKKQKQLEEAVGNAQAKIDEVNDFFQNVYNVVKYRLDNLRQRLWTLPSDVVDNLNQELKLNCSDPDKVWKYAGLILSITEGVVGVLCLFFVGLASAGIATADGIAANIGAVLAVVGFGLTLYNGVIPLKKRDGAIENVNGKGQQAEDAMADMKKSLDGLLATLGLKEGSYETVKDMSFDDWANFDPCGITGFALGEGQSHANYLVIDKDTPSLKGDVPALAKLIGENIAEMNATGKIQLSMDRSQAHVEASLYKDKGSPSFNEDVTPALAAKLIEGNILKMNAAGKIQLSLSRQQICKRKPPRRRPIFHWLFTEKSENKT